MTAGKRARASIPAGIRGLTNGGRESSQSRSGNGRPFKRQFQIGHDSQSHDDKGGGEGFWESLDGIEDDSKRPRPEFGAAEVDEDESVSGSKQKETDEETRLRLAKAYLARVRKEEDLSGGNSSDNDIESDREVKYGELQIPRKGGDGRVAGRLAREVFERTAMFTRAVAATISRPDDSELRAARVLRGHRLSVTALCISPDDRYVYSCSKDGSVIRWDVNAYLAALDSRGEFRSSFRSVAKFRTYLRYDDGMRLTRRGKDNAKSVAKLNHGVDSIDGGDNRQGNGKRKKFGGRSRQQRHFPLCIAVSPDGKLLATGGKDGQIRLWDTQKLQQVDALAGHRGPVNGVAFLLNSSLAVEGTKSINNQLELLSGGDDRTLKLWNASERSYVDTLFGHQCPILGVSASPRPSMAGKQRAYTTSTDRTLRQWKITEETQLVFRVKVETMQMSDCVAGLSDNAFVSGGLDGSLALWSILKKKPQKILPGHGYENSKTRDDGAEKTLSECWVSAVAACPGGDLIASGASDGKVRLWSTSDSHKDIEPLFDLPAPGHVNALAISKTGKFVVAGCGQEERLGRWRKIATGRNGILIHRLDVQGDALDVHESENPISDDTSDESE